ncbi:MAG TPA: hypothetical protein VG755_07780 [Nannocystaceae bacterium]|nr:hypothetical protein [Nannocystaceae bacterium]
MTKRNAWTMVLVGFACGDDASAVDSTSNDATTAMTTSASSTDTGADESSTAAPGSEASSGGSSSTADASSDGGDASTGVHGSEASDDGGPAPNCPTDMLALPAMFEGDTTRAGSSFAGPCGGAAAPDASFVFTAPHAGSFAFDTLAGCPISDELGPSHDLPICPMDTVLYALDGECDGDVLACADDSFGTASVLGLQLEAEQTVTIVVDGVGAIGGPFTLRASELAIACPIAAIDTVPSTVSAQTAIATNGHDAQCFGNGNHPDAMFTFTAPHAGMFAFDTPQTAFDTLVFVLDGVCDGDELACSYELPVEVSLAAGQTVTVGVEGLFASDVGELQLRVQAGQ